MKQLKNKYPQSYFSACFAFILQILKLFINPPILIQFHFFCLARVKEIQISFSHQIEFINIFGTTFAYKNHLSILNIFVAANLLHLFRSNSIRSYCTINSIHKMCHNVCNFIIYGTHLIFRSITTGSE